MAGGMIKYLHCYGDVHSFTDNNWVVACFLISCIQWEVVFNCKNPIVEILWCVLSTVAFQMGLVRWCRLHRQLLKCV